MKFFWLFFGCLLSIQICFAQQPAYYILGEEQFRGIQIYDVIQDQEQNYWFATNEGIYFYDYYTFKKVECDKAKSNSVFNFTKNNEGTIYCHNLNNQVFQIKAKEFKLFYELSDEETNPDISLTIANDGNVVIGAKKIIVLNKNGNKILEFDINKKYLGPAYKAIDNRIQFNISNSDSIVSYSKGVFSKHKLLYLSGKPERTGVLKFFRRKNICYAIDLKSKITFAYNPLKFELTSLPNQDIYTDSLFKRSQSVRIYETENQLWVVGTLPGVTIIQDDLFSANNSIYYKDYYISDVYKDFEGNILLSTFDKGILVIPDLKVPDVINSFRTDPVTSLYSDTDLGLLLGSSKGTLFSYSNGVFKNINNNNKRPIEGIYGDAKSKLIVFDDGLIRAYNKQTKEIINVAESSLKDAVFVSENQFYLGTNNGIIKCNWQHTNKFTVEWVKDLNIRIYSLEYDSEKKLLYAATSYGLLSISNLGIIKKIIYKNETVFSKSLHYNSGKLFVPTAKNGILIIEGSEVKDSILPIISGKTEVLTKINIYQHTIIAKSPNGFFQFDMRGKLLKSLHTIFGFSAHRVIDFTFQENKLWVSHSGGMQQIDLKYKQSNLSKPVIKVNEIFVNDLPIAMSTQNYFNSKQRKIQFILSSPTLRNREAINYYYKLEGYDTKWNINNYTSNQITYNALAPGNYNFQVKIENQGIFSNPIFYSFSIAQPFYNRWWFIVCSALLFLGLVIIIYRRQLTIQQKKSEQINELNASKLIAIQSQMNPHFIFNALNSIQDLVLKGDIEHSYSFITTFSNLVRRTLSYSEKDFIDFDQEIKLLEIYLSLEKLRFKKDLKYEIDYKTVEDIMLPPLLIQPFVENALIHGLLHKAGEKHLKINFELKDMLICTIQDNGIGREKAKAIKLRQNSEHESFSGKAIHKRFEILSNVFDGNFGYVYQDLYQNDEAVGTKVTLSIPIKHKF
ncbi:MAG: histidine kinase [Bacteroidota bacterium]|nr:histidine kinase [Bacteroidota bacterium]